MSFIEKLLNFFTLKRSSRWAIWLSQKDLKTCALCKDRHGKIFPLKEVG